MLQLLLLSAVRLVFLLGFVVAFTDASYFHFFAFVIAFVIGEFIVWRLFVVVVTPIVSGFGILLFAFCFCCYRHVY